MRFLIAGNDPKIAGFICEGLRQEGQNMATAVDGKSSLAHFAQGAVTCQETLLPRPLPDAVEFSDMLAGVAIANLAPSVTRAVMGLSVGTTAISIAIGLILIMYPPPAKVLSLPRVLFFRVEHSNRSQFTKAFARLPDSRQGEASDAGSEPSSVIKTRALKAMCELG